MTASPPSVRARTITPAEHRAFVAAQDSVSFLQTPGWGAVKREWRAESLGWFGADAQPVGAGLVLYRRVPRLRRYLAYLPEGPALDWAAPWVADALRGLVDHVAARGAFAVRIGPAVVARRWSADTVKQAVADPAYRRLGDVPPDARGELADSLSALLRGLGWRPQVPAEGFGLGQPAYVFQLPLAGRSEDDLLAGMNQLWRRNLKKAAKAGVVVGRGGPRDLPAFHRVYVETAGRESFTARPLDYFERMFAELARDDPDRIRLYLAHHEGDLVAATTMVRVGAHAWYSYGASTTAKREVRGSNAVQWQMIRDARSAGATVYDLRGITDTVRADDPHVGLLQFKAGTGGEAVEYVGEWDLPLQRLLYRGFSLYLRRR